MTINNNEMQQFLTEVKLHINQQLYNNGHITQEMYVKAKDMILRQLTSLSCGDRI